MILIGLCVNYLKARIEIDKAIVLNLQSTVELIGTKRSEVIQGERKGISEGNGENKHNTVDRHADRYMKASKLMKKFIKCVVSMG